MDEEDVIIAFTAGLPGLVLEQFLKHMADPPSTVDRATELSQRNFEIAKTAEEIMACVRESAPGDGACMSAGQDLAHLSHFLDAPDPVACTKDVDHPDVPQHGGVADEEEDEDEDDDDTDAPSPADGAVND